MVVWGPILPENNSISSQSLVVKDGVLNQAPEFLKARKLANLNTAAVFDLLCLASARWKQYSTLNEVGQVGTTSNKYQASSNKLTI